MFTNKSFANLQVISSISQLYVKKTKNKFGLFPNFYIFVHYETNREK